MILGIDEVGRGPWAGPLVVGAVVLPDAMSIEGLNDSKKLSAKKRQALALEIYEKAHGFGLGWVHADELDSLGLSRALRVATVRAVEAVKAPYHEIIIDGTINFLKETSKGKYVTTLAKADALIPAVSAASIIAKVARDTFMEKQDELYPGYGFKHHVGYGTAKHRAALEAHGITPLHRTSFAPIKMLQVEQINEKESKYVSKISPSPTTIGLAAEARIAQWLEARQFKIIARNWRTKYCEIDIIAETITTRYYIEVRHRTAKNQGTGLDSITPKKMQKMCFAAALYQAKYPTQKSERLAVVATGQEKELILTEVE